MRQLSLRARLVLGVIVLAAIGLAGADVATYASLRSFLVERTDESRVERRRAHGEMMADAAPIGRLDPFVERFGPRSSSN